MTFLHAGANPNAQNEAGEMAIMFAVKGINPLSEPHAKLQRIIIKSLMFGADPGKKNESGATALDDVRLVMDKETKRLLEAPRVEAMVTKTAPRSRRTFQQIHAEANASRGGAWHLHLQTNEPLSGKAPMHELGTDGPQRYAPLRPRDVLGANFAIISLGSEEAVVNFRPWACLRLPGTNRKSL